MVVMPDTRYERNPAQRPDEKKTKVVFGQHNGQTRVRRDLALVASSAHVGKITRPMYHLDISGRIDRSLTHNYRRYLTLHTSSGFSGEIY